MNKLIKLIYINLLRMFDINKILIARNDGVKSNLENKSILSVIILLVSGFILYEVLSFVGFDNKINYLITGFIISTLLCIGTNIGQIEGILFKNKDNDMLLAMPITKYQILFSKLFEIYLKDIMYVVVVMISSVVVYIKDNGYIHDSFGIMYFLIILVTPLLPIVLSTILVYINDYFKIKLDNNILYKLLKFLLIIILFGLIFLFFDNIKLNNINVFFERVNYIYPFINLMKSSLIEESFLAFLAIMVIPIIIIYIYSKFISDNYLRMCSLLNGVKKKREFKLKRVINKHKVFGITYKELLNLMNNRPYLVSSYMPLILCSICLFICFKINIFSYFDNVENFSLYFNLYLPTFLAMFVTLSNHTISSMSLEKDNFQILRTMPISIGKIIFGKWLSGCLIGGLFVLINSLMVIYFLELDFVEIMFCLFVPLAAVFFVNLTSLVIDYRFINKGELNDNFIIKQRVIVIVPMFMSMIIGFGPLLFFPGKIYKYFLGSYILGMLLLMVCEIIYIVIKRKKLLDNVFR